MTSETKPHVVKWLGLFNSRPITRQGELDYACGLCCVVSAAIALKSRRIGAVDDAVSNLVRHLEPAMAHRFLKRPGCPPTPLLDVAQVAGLRPTKVLGGPSKGIADIAPTEKDFCIAMVTMRFDRTDLGSANVIPARKKDVLAYPHYVLVLDVTRSMVTVADPHPWHREQYEIAVPDFIRGWTMARATRWAARLSLHAPLAKDSPTTMADENVRP